MTSPLPTAFCRLPSLATLKDLLRQGGQPFPSAVNHQPLINMKSLFLLGAFASLLCSSSGCVSSKTTTINTPVVHPDGSITTNTTTTITVRGQDPLKDKIVKITQREKGLHFKIASTPGGTTGALSPLDLFFGMAATTIETVPVYAGTLSGYTPPVSTAGSDASSLWNDAGNSYIATEGNLNPAGAYSQSSVVSPNILQPITVGQGQVVIITNTTPPVVTDTNTPAGTVTNAPASAKHPNPRA